MVVFEILKALSVFCAVTGTMPFTVVKYPSIILRFSPYRSAWTCVLAALTACNVYVTPSFFINFTNTSHIEVTAKPESNWSDQAPAINQEDTQMLILKVLNPSIIFIMSLSSHFVALFSLRTQLPHFVCGYLAVDKKLERLTKTELHSKHHMIYFYGVMLFPFPTFAFYIYTVLDQKCSKFIWSLSQVFHNITSYYCEMQFLLFCYALGIGFRRINESFPMNSGRDLIWQQTWLHPRDPMFGEMQRLSVPRIVLAQDCYLILSRLMALLNTMYSIQILFSMSGCFIKALLNVYFAFFGAHLPSNEPSLLTQGQVDILKTISWTIYYSLRFIVLAMVATNTTDEAEKTKFVISSLRTRLMEPSIKEAAFSAGMTYLFILIQYKLQIYFP